MIRHIQEAFNLLWSVKCELDSAQANDEMDWGNWIEMSGQVQHMMDILERDHDVEYMG